jgi:hypothetical protein
MTTITSPVHSETIAGWSPIGPLASGMRSSLAFTVLTGLAERLVFPPPSAFRTCYGPRCLSAQGKSRDLRHFSPMPTRGGNSVLRDMAHMIVRPIQASIPHRSVPFWQERDNTWKSLEWLSPYTPVLKARPSNHQFAQGSHQGSAPSFYQSNWGNYEGFPWQSIPTQSVYTGRLPFVERAWN